jgi:hypothetical protein
MIMLKKQMWLGGRTASVLPALLGFLAIGHSASPPKTFQNPILSGMYPDPSICRTGDDYYTFYMNTPRL